VPAVTIGKLGRDIETDFAASVDLLQSFGPARNHPIQLGLHRLAMLRRAIKDRVVEQLSGVVYRDRIGRSRVDSRARL